MQHTLWKGLAAALLAAGFCGALAAQAGQPLFDKTHKGAKESKVAGDWWEKLPDWVSKLTTKNTFPQTHLLLDGEFRPSKEASKFEIRDANRQQFSAYYMAKDGYDGNGRPIYKVAGQGRWLSWKQWPGKYLVETYPIESNDSDADLVAFGAWLLGEKENDLGNRVLTVAHHRNKDLAPLIEAYLIEKLGWAKDGPLEDWAEWDAEYQVERTIMVTAKDKAARVAAREKTAEKLFKEIVAGRGDYKGKAPRPRSPTKMLVLLEWEIKQFKAGYGNSDFLKNPKNVDLLTAISDSITDDLGMLKDNVPKAKALAKDDKDVPGMKAKAEQMELLLKVDPCDLSLRGECANAWYLYGHPAEHGNGCDRADGIKKAIPHYEVISAALPMNTSFLLALGRCWQALENSKEAKPYYERVVAIEGNKGNGSMAQSLMRNMDQKDQARGKK